MEANDAKMRGKTADLNDLGSQASNQDREIEDWLRFVDAGTLKFFPNITIKNVEFMEDIFSLVLKNLQTKKSMLIRFQERDMFDSTSDDDRPAQHRVSDTDGASEGHMVLPPKDNSEIEFDAPDQKPAPIQKEQKIAQKENAPIIQVNTSQIASVPAVPQDRDDRIKFHQVSELPKNYIPMISSSVPEQLVNNRHYMIPALLDNIAFFTYGACATCTVPECKNCQKLKNPKNGVRAELRMFLLSNQEVTVIAFNKVASEGFHLPHEELVQMVKQNRDRTNSTFLWLYLGHPFVFDKLFRGKPVEEKEVTNQFYALAPECLPDYHKKLQI